MEAIALTGWEQQRRGFTAEHILALAHVAKALNVRGAAQPDERGLLVAGFTAELFTRLAPDRTKGKIGPPRGRGKDPFGGVADKVAHRPRARRKARFLLSSTAAASAGVSGPGITSCSTTSQPR